MLRLFWVGFVVLVASATCCGELLSPTLAHNDRDREYLLYVPSGDVPEGGFPLVVSMHGRLANGAFQSEWTEMNPIAEREGFIVAYPEAINADWAADTTSEDFVLQVIGQIKNDYEIDNTRVFAAGFSQGGWMAYELAAEHPGIFAAVAAAGSNQSRLPSRPIPILHMHGTNDEIWGLDSKTLDIYATANQCGDSTGTPLPDIESDSTTTEHFSYECANYLGADFQPRTADFEYYKTENGGHNWPSGFPWDSSWAGNVSRDFHGSEVIWDFFAQHQLPVANNLTRVGGGNSIATEQYDRFENLAGTATATLSGDGRGPERVIDGDPFSFVSTRGTNTDDEHWLDLTLPDENPLHRIEIVTSDVDGVSLVGGEGFRVTLFDKSGEAVFERSFKDVPYSAPFQIELDKSVVADRARIQKNNPVAEGRDGRLQLSEVALFSSRPFNDSDSAFEFEIGPTSNDLLVVPGVFNLSDSPLKVSLIDVEPAAGDRYDLIDAEEILGDFGLIDLPELAAGLTWDLTNLSIDGSVAVREENSLGDCNGDGIADARDLSCVANVAERDAVLVQINSLPGDLDGDGVVAFKDFLVLSSNFGAAADVSYALGDIDLDGAVQFADFLTLSQNFGQATTAIPVPEPSTNLLFLFVLGHMFVRATRSCRRCLEDEH